MEWLSLSQARRCWSGYPVASAGLSRSKPGAGVHVESTRRLNDMDPCPRFATPSVPTRRDTRATGNWHFQAQTWDHPGIEARRSVCG
jgi:hypothetical protein